VFLAPSPLAPELPELPLLLAPALLAAKPVVLPLLPNAPLTLEECARGAPNTRAEPEEPPGPLEPLVASPAALLVPDAADPDALAEPEAPDEAAPPVEPDDWLVVWLTGPEAPDVPPVPVPETLFDWGLDEAEPLTPPLAEPVAVVFPDEPDEALPEELPVEPPLDPPVDVPVAGPLLPLLVEVPVPLPGPAVPDPVPATAPAAGVEGAVAAVAGPLFRAATSAMLEISPTTAGKSRPSTQAKQPLPPNEHQSATATGRDRLRRLTMNPGPYVCSCVHECVHHVAPSG
jgi:hypothetical protein